MRWWIVGAFFFSITGIEKCEPNVHGVYSLLLEDIWYYFCFVWFH